MDKNCQRSIVSGGPNAMLSVEATTYPMLIKIKGTVPWQYSSFCLILPITHPQSLWNLKPEKKLHANDKIIDTIQTYLDNALTDFA